MKILTLIALCSVSALPGAELSMGAAVLAPGAGGILSVAYASQGAQVNGLQFDLGYDSSNLSVNPIAASSVRSAGKGRYYQDLPGNLHRLMVAGWNQTALSDGPLFTMYVNVSPNASPGNYAVTLNNVVGVDSSGNPVPISFGAGEITVSTALGTNTSPIQSTGVLNGASLLSGSVSPGGIVTLIGSAIGPATAATLQLTSSGTVSTNLNNTEVTFDGIPAPLIYAGFYQINAVVPFEVSNQTTSMAIAANGQLIGPISIPVAATTPAILTQDSSGTGQAWARNLPDMSVNTPTNPVPAGGSISLLLIGAGQSTPAQITGSVDEAAGNTNATVTATVGGVSANIGYAGPAPGLIAGATQVNLTIPSTVAASPAVPILIQIGKTATQADVYISVSAAQ
jgi:uncharacterized protein (TIGR03437 family)